MNEVNSLTLAGLVASVVCTAMAGKPSFVRQLFFAIITGAIALGCLFFRKVA